MFSNLMYRLRALFRRNSMEEELDKELRAHVEQQTEKYVQAGMSPVDAARRARLEFGGVEQIKEEVRDSWGVRFISELAQDIRYGLRQLRRSPGFTVVAVLTLALGIGANTAMFSFISAVLLHPLPFPHPDRLVQIWEVNHQLGVDRDVVSAYNFRDWHRQSKDFAAMSTYDYHHFSYTGGKLPISLDGMRVTADFFRVVGVQPYLGRNFLQREDESSRSRLAIVSYAAWQDYFGGKPDTVGKQVTLDGEPYTLIGVMPSSFHFPSRGISVWTTPGFDLKELTRGDHGLYAIGRVKPGVNLAAAQSEMDTVAHRLALQYPDTNRDAGVRLVSLRQEIVGNVQFALLVLWVAVALVLLIASANVANLLLSRGVSRRKEFAVRSALGAARSRILTQLLTESILLSTVGGVLGLILSRWAVGAISHITAIPHARTVAVDAQVLAFTVLLIVLTGIVFGLAPAFTAFSLDVISSLKESGPAGNGRLTRLRLKNGLVIGEIAVTVVLLAGAGLLIRSLYMLGRVDPGFNARGVLGARMSLPTSKYPNGLDRSAVFQQVIEQIAAIPGVKAVGGVNDLPFSGSRTSSSFDIPGWTPTSPQQEPHADYRTVSSGYFKTMAIPLLKGREFTPDDRQGAPDVAIINEDLAQKYFPGRDPLGRHLNLHDKVWEIIGIVGDVKLLDLAAKDRPEIYVPFLQAGSPPWMFFAVRGYGQPESLIRSVRKAAQEVVPDEPLYAVGAIQGRMESSVASRRLSALLLAIFAALAMVLAAVGTYGVIAYAAEQRTREIGIRMALGAEKRDVLKMVVGQGLKLALIGVAVGIAGALALTRFLSSLLYGVKPTDPLTFIAVSLILIAVALLACYIPARRASKVDPMVALRYE